MLKNEKDAEQIVQNKKERKKQRKQIVQRLENIKKQEKIIKKRKPEDFLNINAINNYQFFKSHGETFDLIKDFLMYSPEFNGDVSKAFYNAVVKKNFFDSTIHGLINSKNFTNSIVPYLEEVESITGRTVLKVKPSYYDGISYDSGAYSKIANDFIDYVEYTLENYCVSTVKGNEEYITNVLQKVELINFYDYFKNRCYDAFETLRQFYWVEQATENYKSQNILEASSEINQDYVNNYVDGLKNEIQNYFNDKHKNMTQNESIKETALESYGYDLVYINEMKRKIKEHKKARKEQVSNFMENNIPKR